MSTIEQTVIERLNLYRANPNAWQWIKEYESDKEFGTWVRVVAQHFEKELLPRLKGYETLVEFFQAQFLWGQETNYSSGITNNRVYQVQTGTFGTGYFCLTTANIYIVSFAELTKKYPLKESSFIGTVLLSILGQRDETKPLQKNGSWTIPLHTIRDVQILESSENSVEKIILATDAITWNFFVVNDLSFTLAAINMARFNQLGATLTKVDTNDMSTNGHAAKLQNLKNLFEAGL